ncbi:LuxR C-terminal-related transcriptional regulator [Petropleomorpha daqingensis]|uniref:DNA-binding CsgD family transcriptional regulator n=1 Tax=Petropleomorpha daqingensis TaxID=2026353 RepID=A0A853CKY0_9ACTN|nr:DNA-binding CsgD family transcriptional regulator [Petropleomorpha daqingensis]
MEVPARDAIERSRAALRAGDAATARELLGGIVEPDGEVWELLGSAAYLELDFARTAEHWERACTAYRRSGGHAGAVRAARMLCFVHMMVLGHPSVAQGWLGRAQTLLSGVPDSREAGWVALNVGMFDGDRARKEEGLRRALEVARTVGDADLEFAALGYLGASLVHADRMDEGMALLDEALAAVTGGDVDDFFVLEEIFCQLFAACEHACDVRRAEEWIAVGEEVARRRNLPAVSAFCRTHYGGVLTTAGRWTEAEEALTAAVGLWGLSRRSALRMGALARLAELRVRQGRVDEAAQLLAELDLGRAGEAARPLAAVHLVRGEPDLAADVLERALAEGDAEGAAAAPLWALLVDVHLAAGRVEAAADAAERVARCAERVPRPHLTALAALARGQLCVAEGTDPSVCLREALTGFAAAGMPMELARARLALARAVHAERPAVARAEARAALEAFQRLPAARDADAAAAFLRELGVRAPVARRTEGVLTAREEEVLGLLGAGLTNPEIAARLFISRKTVEHHVANVLAKLALRSRAEAAGYAARTGSAAR